MQKQGFRGQKVEKVLHLPAKVSIAQRPEVQRGARESSRELWPGRGPLNGAIPSKVGYIFIRNNY